MAYPSSPLYSASLHLQKRSVIQTLLTTTFLLMVWTSPSVAGVPTTFLQAQVKAARVLIAQPTPDRATRARVDQGLMKLIHPLMNFPVMSRAVIGKRWAGLKPADQGRFITLFRDLVFFSYLKRIRSANEEYTMVYEDEEVTKEGAMVEAIAQTKKGEIELSFKLSSSKTAGAFEVSDVLIDEVSLVENYREQFTKIIQKDGFEALIKRMEDQLEKVKR
jgi:phospholipid transport system substrate-binding protein